MVVEDLQGCVLLVLHMFPFSSFKKNRFALSIEDVNVTVRRLAP